MNGRFPVFRVLAALLGVVVMGLMLAGWLKWGATEIQRAYLTSEGDYLYLRTTVPHIGRKQERFQVLGELRPDGQMYLATDVHRGVTWLRVVRSRRELHQQLAMEIYGGGVMHAAHRQLVVGACAMLLLLAVGFQLDRKRIRWWREIGRQVSGRRLVSLWRFNLFTVRDRIEFAAKPFKMQREKK